LNVESITPSRQIKTAKSTLNGFRVFKKIINPRIAVLTKKPLKYIEKKVGASTCVFVNQK
jgi:hypothetical protein